MQRVTLYAVLLIAFVAVSVSIVRQYQEEALPATEAFWATIQPITLAEAVAERTRLNAIVDNPPNVESYFTVVIEGADVLELRLSRTMRDRWSKRADYGAIEQVIASTTCFFGGCLKPRAMQAYQEKFGKDAWHRAAEPWNKTHRQPGPQYPDMAPYWRRWYLLGMLLAGIFLALRLKAKGLTLWMELLQPYRYALAVVAWPVFIWRYPSHTPAQQLVWGLRYATLILGTLLGGGAGVAKAETVKDGSKRDRKGKHSLQVDLRASDVVGGPGPAEALCRVTATHAGGPFVESVNIVRHGFWLTSDVLGMPMVKPGPFVVNGVAGAVLTSTGSRTLTASAQMFGGGKYWGLAVPVFGVERQLVPVFSTTLTSTAQVFLKPTPLLRVGVEGSVRKMPGRPATWSLGGIVGWSFGKGKPQVEGGIFHSSADVERARGRLVQTWAW